jgi:hypothetical protein
MAACEMTRTIKGTEKNKPNALYNKGIKTPHVDLLKWCVHIPTRYLMNGQLIKIVETLPLMYFPIESSSPKFNL